LPKLDQVKFVLQISETKLELLNMTQISFFSTVMNSVSGRLPQRFFVKGGEKVFDRKNFSEEKQTLVRESLTNVPSVLPPAYSVCKSDKIYIENNPTIKYTKEDLEGITCQDILSNLKSSARDFEEVDDDDNDISMRVPMDIVRILGGEDTVNYGEFLSFENDDLLRDEDKIDRDEVFSAKYDDTGDNLSSGLELRLQFLLDVSCKLDLMVQRNLVPMCMVLEKKKELLLDFVGFMRQFDDDYQGVRVSSLNVSVDGRDTSEAIMVCNDVDKIVSQFNIGGYINYDLVYADLNLCIGKFKNLFVRFKDGWVEYLIGVLGSYHSNNDIVVGKDISCANIVCPFGFVGVFNTLINVLIFVKSMVKIAVIVQLALGFESFSAACVGFLGTVFLANAFPYMLLVTMGILTFALLSTAYYNPTGGLKKFGKFVMFLVL
jgi:hypothetical protein